MDYTAVGDTTNLAARLLALAKPGQIVVSQPTQHLRAGFFTFEDLGEFQVKGKSVAVRAYALTGERHGRTRLEVSKERGLTALVGRDRELERLRTAFRRATGGKAPRSWCRASPAWASHGCSTSSRTVSTEPRSSSSRPPVRRTARSMPYRPVLDLLRVYLHLAVGASEDEIRTRAADQLELLGLDGEERAVLLAHFLGASAPAEFLARLSGAQLKGRTVDLVGDLFLRASESFPALVIVENVHWADASSGELLAHLARHLAVHRFLLILSGRPGPLPWLPPEATETISIEGLEGAETERMARSALGVDRVAEPLRELLVGKGAGNPLYVEEILRQLQETGGLWWRMVRRGSAGPTSRCHRDPRHHRRPRRSARGPGQAHLQGARSSAAGSRLRCCHASSAHRPRPSPGHWTSSTAWISSSRARPIRADVQLQACAHPGRGVREPPGAPAAPVPRATGIGLEELYAERPDEIVELLVHHFGRGARTRRPSITGFWPPRRPSVTGRTPRPSITSTAPSHAWRRCRTPSRIGSAASTPSSSKRRSGSRWASTPSTFDTLEAIRHLVEQVADPLRRAAWYCWAGFLHSLTGARTDVPDRLLSRGARRSRRRPVSEEIRAIARLLPTSRLRARGQPPRSARGGRARAGCVRGARKRVVDLPDALGPEHGRERLGEWARSLEYCRAGARARQGRQRPPTEGGRLVAHRLDARPAGRCRGRACVLRGNALALVAHPVRRRDGPGRARLRPGQGRGGRRRRRPPWRRPWRGSAVEPAFHGSRGALRLVEGYLLTGEQRGRGRSWSGCSAVCQESGYRHFEGAAQRLLGAVLAEEDAPAAAAHLRWRSSIARRCGRAGRA